MNWSIGHGRPDVTYLSTAEGTIYANGSRITDADGWLTVPPPPEAAAFGMPAQLRARVRTEASLGAPTKFYLDEVVADGRSYGTLEAFSQANGPLRSFFLIQAVAAELERRTVMGLKRPPARRLQHR